MDDPFWTHDTFLFEGTFRYYRNTKQPVRSNLHISNEKYDFNEFGHSLERNSPKAAKGIRVYMLMHPYVIEPNRMMTLAVNPKYYADSGTVLGKISGTHIEGFRDVKIGNAQAWYYPDDRVLVLWECFLHDFVRDLPLRKDPHMALLWAGFEKWLINRYPEAEKILTPWADPLWQVKEYQFFLRKRGYKRDRAGIFAKLIK